ncbi:radical SAM protein [Ferruginibacter lapsinanis]|uniref:GTP 3',8-cyclase MoaA n=1 Tax=Ferruginibacter lapsinanis TaxID=563172 RepID=UPI001E2A8AA9|nr:radical SAM protein [Ferruginibacter lapsinanis]UEG50102.1 radical SAM protein [Ferruginibacter lapsinanis]
MHLLKDIYNRDFKTLRVSLLSRCNLSCVYCTMGEDDIKDANHTAPVDSVTLLQTIQQLHDLLQLETIRLTGGEPLLYHELIPVIKGIKAMGIDEIKLTTNGFLLERMAEQMKDAGMRSINVSLDAIDEDVFFLMSKRSHVQRILDGIDKAVDAGLQVKINAVIMKGVNDTQLLPLLDYAFARNITIRFLEVMAMGHLHAEPAKYLFTQEDILSTIATKYNFKKINRADSSTANYWQTEAGNKFGIIANESEPFCHDCNRLRLDSDGNIYGCLSSNHPISLKHVTDTQTLIEKLQQAMDQKQVAKFVGSELSMLHIGG